MQKILTLFERHQNGAKKGGVTPTIKLPPRYGLGHAPIELSIAIATEKLDGTNVRVTVRNHMVMRIEKRCNPSKEQKRIGIIEPWYTDVQIDDPADRHIRRAVAHTNIDNVPDGEWSGEAIGPKIQGNPLNLESPRVVFFTLGQAPTLPDVPQYTLTDNITITDSINNFYCRLREYLRTAETRVEGGTGCMEGIVWVLPGGEMLKIKRKDFGF